MYQVCCVWQCDTAINKSPLNPPTAPVTKKLLNHHIDEKLRLEKLMDWLQDEMRTGETVNTSALPPETTRPTPGHATCAFQDKVPGRSAESTCHTV